jgi:hypothetical protein
MNLYQIRVLLVLLLGLVLASCSTKNIGDNINPEREASGFNLRVLEASYIDGANADAFTLEVEDYGDSVVANVNAENAYGLKALYFDLEYDPALYRPMVVEPTDAMGTGNELINLRMFKDRGTVHYGQVQTNFQWRTGFSGDGTLAQVMFRKEPALNMRAAKVATCSAASATILTWDPGTNTLSWPYYNQGDCDQNGEVNIADLTPIGANFGVTGAQNDPNSNLSVIDGDGNGEINISDLTPIGANFNASVLGGYNVYEEADDSAYPALPCDESTVIPLANVAWADRTGDTNSERQQFSYVVGAPIPNGYYWVRPVDAETNEGTSSNVASFNPDAPVLGLTNPPGSGNGTAATPYVANVATDYVFTLVDPVDGDVSNDANTTYIVSNPAAGSIDTADATLNIEDAFTGTFNVQADYNGEPNRADTTIYMLVPEPGDEFYILADSADPDWGAPVTGVGTEADPYVLDHTDYAKEYSYLANRMPDGSGDAIDVNDLTWDSWPPFIAIWTAPGTMQALEMFTSGYVFAQDAETNNSDNNVYVEVHDLPE